VGERKKADTSAIPRCVLGTPERYSAASDFLSNFRRQSAVTDTRSWTWPSPERGSSCCPHSSQLRHPSIPAAGRGPSRAPWGVPGTPLFQQRDAEGVPPW